MFLAEPPHRSRVDGLFFLLVIGAINFSTLQAKKLPVKTYTTADVLGGDQINRIVQDSHGFLWFCTAEGLSRFDGYEFTNYTTADGPPATQSVTCWKHAMEATRWQIHL
jgi:ligand-binding sensor domain-containing protein